MLRIAFAGTPQFALPTLIALTHSQHQLVGVLTQPDRPAGRGRASKPSAVKQFALQLALPLSQPLRLSAAEQCEQLRSWAPELLVVVAYGLILPAAVLALPARGCINVHASLLPRWRGAAPIQHAILAGDDHSGVSIMQMRAGLDAGPVLATARVPIEANVTAAQLGARLAQLGADLLVDTLDALQAGRTVAHEQSEHGVTFAPKITKQQAGIDWRQDAQQLARQVRAFNPWPVAQTLWRGAQLRVWQARALGPGDAGDHGAGAQESEPGTVLALVDDELYVRCGRGVLAVAQLQLAGRRVLGAREFARGATPLGERLGV